MQKNVEILDIPSIQEKVHQKHRDFMKEYGVTLEKVMAEHKLFVDRVMAKLHRILIVFTEEKVIDDLCFNICDITLVKANSDTYICIKTNGFMLVLESYKQTGEFISDEVVSKKIVYDVNKDNFNWTDFAIQLLDFIHSTIYDRKEVAEQRLKGIMEDRIPKDQIKKVEKKK